MKVVAVLTLILIPLVAESVVGSGANELVAEFKFENASNILGPTVGEMVGKLDIPRERRWNITDIAVDESMGVTQVDGPPGFGKAVHFNGTSCFRLTNFAPISSAYNYSVSLWLKLDSPCLSGWCTAVGMWEANALIMHIGSNNPTDARLTFAESSLGDWPGLPTAGLPETGPINGTWIWIASIREVKPDLSGFLRHEFWINGKLVSNGTQNTQPHVTPNSPYPRLDYLNFGCKYVRTNGANPVNAFHGALDEFRMYERALDPQEVTTLFECNDPLCQTCDSVARLCSTCAPFAQLVDGNCVCTHGFTSPSVCAPPPTPAPTPAPTTPVPTTTPAPTPAPTPSSDIQSSPSSSSSSSDSSNTMIYAASGGGVILVLLIALIAFVLFRRSRASKPVQPFVPKKGWSDNSSNSNSSRSSHAKRADHSTQSGSNEDSA